MPTTIPRPPDWYTLPPPARCEHSRTALASRRIARPAKLSKVAPPKESKLSVGKIVSARVGQPQDAVPAEPIRRGEHAFEDLPRQAVLTLPPCGAGRLSARIPLYPVPFGTPTVLAGRPESRFEVVGRQSLHFTDFHQLLNAQLVDVNCTARIRGN